MKKVLICLLFSFSLYAEVTPYVAVKPVLGFPNQKQEQNPTETEMKTNFGVGIAGGIAVFVNEIFGFKIELESTYRPSMAAKLYPDDKFDFGTFMLNGSAVFDVDIVSPYVGFGIGILKNYDSDEGNKFSWQLGAGVEFKMVEKFGVALGYQYFHFLYDMGDVELYSHDIVATASYYF